MYAWIDSAENPWCGEAAAPDFPGEGEALFVSAQKRAETNAWFWVENHPEWGLLLGANKAPIGVARPDLGEAGWEMIRILLAGCEDGS